MARNKFDVDETLESPFSFSHLKRAMQYIKRHKFKMIAALLLSALASVAGLFGPKIMQWTLEDAVPNKDVKLLGPAGGAVYCPYRAEHSFHHHPCPDDGPM